MLGTIYVLFDEEGNVASPEKSLKRVELWDAMVRSLENPTVETLIRKATYLGVAGQEVTALFEMVKRENDRKMFTNRGIKGWKSAHAIKPRKRSDAPKSPRNRDTRKCFKCGREGHLKKMCPELPERRQGEGWKPPTYHKPHQDIEVSHHTLKWVDAYAKNPGTAGKGKGSHAKDS